MTGTRNLVTLVTCAGSTANAILLCIRGKLSDVPYRKLRIVRLTPVALALCEHCSGQFHSWKRVQDEAKAELVEQFDVHECQRRETPGADPPSE